MYTNDFEALQAELLSNGGEAVLVSHEVDAALLARGAACQVVVGYALR
jgi:hypothetical protein